MNELFERALSVGKAKLQQKKYKYSKKDPYVKNYGKEVARDEIITSIPLALAGGSSVFQARKRKSINESLAATVAPHARQAATWGVGAALATKLTQGKEMKHMTPAEKKKAKINLLKSGVIGAATGGVGSVI